MAPLRLQRVTLLQDEEWTGEQVGIVTPQEAAAGQLTQYSGPGTATGAGRLRVTFGEHLEDRNHIFASFPFPQNKENLRCSFIALYPSCPATIQTLTVSPSNRSIEENVSRDPYQSRGPYIRRL